MRNQNGVENEESVNRAAIALALGRILRLASRPAQPGDVEQYEDSRRLILDLAGPAKPGYVPSYARDRLKGS
jgi:hypothetical protein